MQTRHHCPDRNVQDLGRVRIREVADVDEDDDVAEIVRHLGQRGHDVVLRQALDDPFLVIAPLAGGFELVVEEVVAFLERLQVRRALLSATTVDVQVREDAREPTR